MFKLIKGRRLNQLPNGSTGRTPARTRFVTSNSKGVFGNRGSYLSLTRQST